MLNDIGVINYDGITTSNFIFKYPVDAITIPFSLVGTQSKLLLATTTTPRTILNATILNYAYNVSQASWIKCGDVKLVEGYYKEGRDARDMNYLCSGAVVAYNVGSVNSNGQIIYLDNISSTSTATSSFTGTYQIDFFLFLFFAITVLSAMLVVFLFYFINKRKYK